MEKETKEIYMKKYYKYHKMTNIMIFLSVFLNLKMITVSKGNFYLMCLTLNSVLISTISVIGAITGNIETIVKFKYFIDIKGTGSFLEKEGICSILYPPALIVINIIIIAISSINLLEGIVISLISFALGVMCFHFINNKYKKIITDYNRQNKINNSYYYQ